MRSKSKLRTYAIEGATCRGWYRAAQDSIHTFAAAVLVPSRTVADVVAITSPRVPIARNVTLARAYFMHGGLAGVIACGVIPSTVAALQHWEATGEIRGRKTEAFARALKGDPTALVLDVHMAHALQVAQAKLFRADNWEKATTRIAWVAGDLDMTMAECQAAIWHGYRGVDFVPFPHFL
jgi:hypothetical protein